MKKERKLIVKDPVVEMFLDSCLAS